MAALRSINSATMAGSVASGAGAPVPPARGSGRTLLRKRSDEIAAIEDGLQRVAGQRIGFSEHPEEAGAAGR